MIAIVLAFLASLLYLFWKDNYGYRRGRPPGPTRLPIIGNLHQIVLTGEKLPYKAFECLSRKHGSLMSLKLGFKEMVVVSSYEEISELLEKEECQGRFLDECLADRSWGRELGIVFSSGEMWKKVRRFTIKNLREFGFGKKTSMEKTMSEEITELFQRTWEKASKKEGKIEMNGFFNLSLVNVLWTMVAGKRYSHDDPRLNHLVDIDSRAFQAGNFGAGISMAFPILRKIFPKLTGAATLDMLFKELRQFFREMLTEHREMGNYKTSPECFLDIFLKEIEKEEETISSSKDRIFTEDQLLVILMDLFQTGSETLGGSLSYALLFIMLNPKVKEKVQKEIERVAPPGTQINFSHKSTMPYTQATLMETLRLANIIPIIPPRKVLKDFNHKGFEFKKGEYIIANMFTVFGDESYWTDAQVFRPERFIGADGELSNLERFTPFGFGKRYCMGESLANAALFLYFTSFLKYFDVTRVDGEKNPSVEPMPAFTLSPQPFNIILTQRE